MKEALTPDHYKRHIYKSDCSIGIYPLIESEGLAYAWADELGGPAGRHFVTWGCSDIDNKADPEACWPLALNLRNALVALGLTAWVERTKGKGYHVWVFCEKWVPAIVMRRALLVAHQVAGVAPTEVNPKQVDLGPHKSWGNYVNLPYSQGWQRGHRRCMVAGDGYPIPLAKFLPVAMESRNTFEDVYEAAKLYIEPLTAPVVRLGEPSASAQALAGQLPGLPWKIWREGPLEGRDRSGTLQRLAYLCAEAGVEAADTLALVTDADQRWGKFSDRPDGAHHLERITMGAYR